MNYYNDIDRWVLAWIENLIMAGQLPEGTIDRRRIEYVTAQDISRYTQCHFFAGIGGWPLALRIAGWPDSEPVWTGSCPCQPFSDAGKGLGERDPRHLWPEFRKLIAECRPPVVFGEQVASADGRLWLCRVRADLEALGYAVGAADLCAAGIGAPHRRQRLYWVANRKLGDSGIVGCGSGAEIIDPSELASGYDADPVACRIADGAGGMADAEGQRGQGHQRRTRKRNKPVVARDGGLGHPDDCERPIGEVQRGDERQTFAGTSWDDCYTLTTRDGKLRRVGAGIFPLAHGLPRTVGQGLASLQRLDLLAAKANRIIRLRGYGNAIVPLLAAEFVMAFMETRTEP